VQKCKDIFAFVNQYTESYARYYIVAEIAVSVNNDYRHGFVTGYMLSNPEGNPFDVDASWIGTGILPLFIQPYHHGRVTVYTPSDLNYSEVKIYNEPLEAHMEAQRILDDYDFVNDVLVLREAVPGSQLVICSKEDAMRYARSK
jgi:hypothetical protein